MNGIDCGLRSRGGAGLRGSGQRAEMVGDDPLGQHADAPPEQITDEQRNKCGDQRLARGVVHREAGDDGHHKGAQAEGGGDESGDTEVHWDDNSGASPASAGTAR
jgi:hypothetical protein